MPATNKLNSLFLRWNGALGIYQGAQCTRFVISSDDAGRELFRGESAPFPVTEAVTADGYLLSQVIGEATTALLVAVETKDAEIATLKAAAKPNEDALAAANAEVAALTAQLAAMQPPINSFSRKAIKVALSDAGLLESFETTISNPQDGPQKLAMISWEEDDTFSKTSPALALTFARMALTGAQIAALFVAIASA